MRKVKKMLPFLLVLIVDFYILPVCIRDTGSGILYLLFIIPLICCVDAIVYGIKYGLEILFVLLAGLLFVPSLFIFYNESAWVYAIGYTGLAFLGNVIGYFLKKILEKK